MSLPWCYNFEATSAELTSNCPTITQVVPQIMRSSMSCHEIMRSGMSCPEIMRSVFGFHSRFHEVNLLSSKDTTILVKGTVRGAVLHWLAIRN